MSPATGSKHPPGIFPTADGKLRAFVRIHPGKGGLHSKTFPAGTGLAHIKRWRQNERARVRFAAYLPSGANTLAEDVRDYLSQIQTMPTLRHRRDDLALWIAAFGPTRERKSITAGEIRATLETWRASGYAASTCNHRRTALMHLWSVLDGKTAPNPARDVPRYYEDSKDAPPRDLSQAAASLILDEMGDTQTRARLELYRWTGWDPATIGRLAPLDIRWDDAVRVKARRKGRGAAGAWLPILPQAWDALRAFRRLGCWGPFSTSSARISFRVAARNARRAIALAYARRTVDRPAARALRAELIDVTPKQLRHTFGTLVADSTSDERAAQELLQHADIRQTRRYTQRTASPRAAAALEAVRAKLAGKVTIELQSEPDPQK